jgi:hypothetical protein
MALRRGVRSGSSEYLRTGVKIRNENESTRDRDELALSIRFGEE